jgi:hypothetical protein
MRTASRLAHEQPLIARRSPHDDDHSRGRLAQGQALRCFEARAEPLCDCASGAQIARRGPQSVGARRPAGRLRPTEACPPLTCSRAARSGSSAGRRGRTAATGDRAMGHLTEPDLLGLRMGAGLAARGLPPLLPGHEAALRSSRAWRSITGCSGPSRRRPDGRGGRDNEGNDRPALPAWLCRSVGWHQARHRLVEEGDGMGWILNRAAT